MCVRLTAEKTQAQGGGPKQPGHQQLRPMDLQTSGPHMTGSGVPKTLPRVQETENTFTKTPKVFFCVPFVGS